MDRQFKWDFRRRQNRVPSVRFYPLEASGCNRANVVHKPSLLSDNGSSYISGDLAEWLEDHGMDHVRGAPYHPQTQGKIERWHQTLKNRILLENYYLPGDLENQIIPTVIDQNPCAHLRMPRDMIFHGWSMRLFQAWQHSATMSS